MGLGSGLPLETAVEQAGKLLEDVPEAAMRCDRCAELLRSGAELPVAMETSGFLLRAESRMLAVGLKQGNSDRIMENIADRLMEQAEEALENTVAKIEPAMVLLASALVGTILLAVMLPLMNIMAAIG
jgi:type IV pilus assembly protein PilC